MLSGVAVVLLALTACAPMTPAPVEQRDPGPSAEPVAVPTVYPVRQGDTLYSIAFRYRLDWREVARWNRIEAPFLIRPGQELRLVAPPQALASSETPSVQGSTEPASEPVQAPAPDPLPAPRPEPAPAPEPVPEPVPEPAPEPQPEPEDRPASAPAATLPADGTRRVAGIDWRWPTAGPVARPFDPAATRRGIGIAGQSGQPVVAAADGRVVYSGTALIGYGELIIIKHSDTLLSAYAHNRVRLVDEGIRVRAGQPIAEMGISDRNQELLHFEVRRNGQPENPLNFLPKR
nr:peptidoglycan DD-metalloendopeptidase family protein [Wenzhouxiangella limi]